MVGVLPRGSRLSNGDELLHELSRSLTQDPAKSSPFGPNKVNATLNYSSGGSPNQLALGNVKRQVWSPSDLAGDIPSTVESLNETSDLSSCVNGPVSESEGISVSNAIIILSGELKLDLTLPSREASCSSPKREADEYPRKRRRHDLEDEDGSGEANSEAKASKRMKLETLRMVSPDECSGIASPDFHTPDQSYSYNLQAPFDLESFFKEEEFDADDPSNRGLAGNDEMQQFPSILPDWFNQAECTPLDFTAAQSTAAQFYLDAFVSLIEYIQVINDAESSLELQHKARTTMANAWNLWQLYAMAPVTMDDLRGYGSKLDAKGRQALAAALHVHSNELQTWFNEPREIVALTKVIFVAAPPQDQSPTLTEAQPSPCTRTPPSRPLTPNPTSPPADVAFPPTPTPVSTPFAATSVVETPEETTVDTESPQQNSDLPEWANDFPQCSSAQELQQWVLTRQAYLKRQTSPPFRGMSKKEEDLVADTLKGGQPLDHPWTLQQRRELEKAAFEALPRNQQHVLLEGKTAVAEYMRDQGKGKGSKNDYPDFVLICRANFYLDKAGKYAYKDKICGSTVRTHESARRHFRETHLDRKRPSAMSK
ncbi:hypothetical protein FRC17_010456 [Serendipita sp. 399]|nr:hypothetical protein FRC17_010456 [Serendipita sp. 399]